MNFISQYPKEISLKSITYLIFSISFIIFAVCNEYVACKMRFL